MRFVHFYPFRPDRDQGGTLRLKTAVAATRDLGDTAVVWFDAITQTWTSDDATPSSAAHGVHGGIKRQLFPHTLFESGRHAVTALVESWDEHVARSTFPVLHTSYLAPALERLGTSAVVDVYDLVWRAHQIDARRARAPLAAVRTAYTLTVRRREEAALRRARGLAVAGWDDHQRLQQLDPPSAWCPTGLSAEPVPPRAPDDRLRIGFIGNFAHQATVDSATALLAAPAARSPDVDVVLGGWESDRHPALRGVAAQILGPVATPADFWRQVDVAVIPVSSGAGIKCKIAEALLADRGVVTTPLGAAGFAPEARRSMAVVERLDDLDADTCRRAANAQVHDAQAFSLPQAAATYRDFIMSLL